MPCPSPIFKMLLKWIACAAACNIVTRKGFRVVRSFGERESQFESVFRISPVAADITSIAPARFTVAMIAPAMMSGQPDSVIAINTAATTVKTFRIASFCVESQIARTEERSDCTFEIPLLLSWHVGLTA